MASAAHGGRGPGGAAEEHDAPGAEAPGAEAEAGAEADVEAEAAKAARLEQLKAALWLHLGTFLDTTLLSLSAETTDASGARHQSRDGGSGSKDGPPEATAGRTRRGRPINADAFFVASLTQLVHTQLELVAGDLESFAGHAGRPGRVEVADVRLLARRNDDLAAMLLTASVPPARLGSADADEETDGRDGLGSDEGEGLGRGRRRGVRGGRGGAGRAARGQGPARARARAASRRGPSARRGAAGAAGAGADSY